MDVDRNELLKKREELLKYKQKLIQVKNKCHYNSSKKKQLHWDNGVLAVLKSDQVAVKSFDPLRSFEKKLVSLPERTDIDTIFHLKGHCFAISFKKDGLYNNYLYLDNEEWTSFSPADPKRIESFHRNNRSIRLIMFDQKSRRITIIDESLNWFKDIEDVERVLNSKESEDVVLLIKSDGSLTIINPFTLEEIIYLPYASKPPKFNFKQIIHFKYDTDASLFLVLFDYLVGRLRMFLCGIEPDGTTEMASIPIPKDNIWLKVHNPFILYQDSDHTVHIISLFTLQEQATIKIDAKIQSCSLINSNNLLFFTDNGEFLHFNP